jgi:hypothetical protein
MPPTLWRVSILQNAALNWRENIAPVGGTVWPSFAHNMR